MSELRIDVTETGQGFVVRLGGEGGYLAAGALQAPLTRLMARRPALVVFDLAELAFVASLLLGVLVGFRRTSARHGGQVRLTGLQPAVRETFEAAGLLSLFCVAATVEEALMQDLES
jgi:anti-sigma B factor antagonist